MLRLKILRSFSHSALGKKLMNPEIVFALSPGLETEYAADLAQGRQSLAPRSFGASSSLSRSFKPSDLLVITNSTQISLEYDIPGLSLSMSLSLSFVGNHHSIIKSQ